MATFLYPVQMDRITVAGSFHEVSSYVTRGVVGIPVSSEWLDHAEGAPTCFMVASYGVLFGGIWA